MEERKIQELKTKEIGLPIDIGSYFEFLTKMSIKSCILKKWYSNNFHNKI